MVGIDQQSTTVHAVALSTIQVDRGQAINLVLLEPQRCQTLTVAGGAGGAGGVIVVPTSDPLTGRVWPGRIAVDSDGSSSCSSKGVISAGGNGATIRADGPAGCADELIAEGPGAGCGEIVVSAPGGPGCAMPACSSTGVVAPTPTVNASPTTRALVDWRYNCKVSYPASVGSTRCPIAARSPAYIDDLVSTLGPAGFPSGYRSYVGAGHPCDVKNTAVSIPVDNWVIDCNLSISESLRFQGGNLVFAGDVTLKGSATLELNASNSNSFHWTPYSPLDVLEHSGRASVAYFRDGTLSMGAQSNLDFSNVMVYLSSSSALDIGSGSGTVSWTAPTTGPFEDLTLWAENTGSIDFGGGAGLALEGVMFAPNADFSYAGNGSQQQVAAQFIAKTLSTNGGGLLAIRPNPDRAVLFPEPTGILIR